MSDGEGPREPSMEEQLRLLTEQVQQLQTENLRLRGTSGSTAEVSRPNTQPGATATAAGRGDGPSAEERPTVSSAARSERYIYLPRERKCPRFSGRASDSLPVVEWVDEARRSLGMRYMSQSEQALFILDHLDGEAKNEIRFRSAAEKNDPEKIFNILIEIYGCTKSFIALQKQFFQRKQLEGESIWEFSHALLSLMEAITRRNSAGIPNPDHTVRDQFAENVRDGLLRRELKRSIRLNPDSSFLTIRSEAVRWVEEGDHVGMPRTRAYSCDSRAQVTGECSTHSASARAVESQSASTPPANEFAELKEGFRQQQLLLNAVLERLGPAQHPPTQRFTSGGPRRRPFQFHPDGRPICWRCEQPGHIARFCQNGGRGDLSHRVQRGPAASVREVEAVSDAVTQSENEHPLMSRASHQ